MKKIILVTGAAGFIGFHTALKLHHEGDKVIGLDNMNSYYDPRLKLARVKMLEEAGIDFLKIDLIDRIAINAVFAEHQPTIVLHLAAQAGVRYSIDNPFAYLDSNLIGFMHILEACREHQCRHLIYASSSSVYGANKSNLFGESERTDHPASLYAATKKANEAMAHSYAHLYNIPITGLRFFTVYGPWGRPDMAYYSFTRKIMAEEPIPVFNHGKMERDFTYIDDAVDATVKLVAQTDSHSADSAASHQIYNIGNNKPTSLEHFISVLEDSIGKKAIRDYQPMQDGDVERTAADISALQSAIGWAPSISIEEGLPRFIDWYKRFHN